jgi:type I restriction enzyme S subunit
MGRLKTLLLRLPLDTQVSGQIDELAAAERALSDEINTLIRTRDELLPLLLSGRVRVGEVAA